MLSEFDCGKVVAQVFDVVGREENPAVLATPADGYERHLGFDELAERSANACAHGWLAPAGPLGPSFGIDELAAEARLKLLGVRPLGKAEDVHVDAVAAKAMAARAEGQGLAEKPEGDVVVACAALGRERHLIWLRIPTMVTPRSNAWRSIVPLLSSPLR